MRFAQVKTFILIFEPYEVFKKHISSFVKPYKFFFNNKQQI